MDDELGFGPTDFLQVTSTLAGIAIALATLTEGEGPKLIGVYVVPTTLLIAGLFLVGSSLLAMDGIWQRAGLRYGTDLFARSLDLHPHRMRGV